MNIIKCLLMLNIVSDFITVNPLPHADTSLGESQLILRERLRKKPVTCPLSVVTCHSLSCMVRIMRDDQATLVGLLTEISLKQRREFKIKH